MHNAYSKPSPLVLQSAIQNLLDAFVEKYHTHVVYLGRMWRVWRNGEWVVGNDVEVTTYFVKLLREKEREDCTPSERACIHAMKELDCIDRMVGLLKDKQGIQASEEETTFRRRKYRKYERWVANLPAPVGEVKRCTPDSEIAEWKYTQEMKELIGDTQLDPSEQFETLGYHVVSEAIPYAPWNI